LPHLFIQLNIGDTAHGSQKCIEIDDEKRIRVFNEKKLSEEFAADFLGEEFKGYILRITGGTDRDGFAMKEGVNINKRVRLLLDGKTGHFRPLRKGQKRRKSVRGCIIGPDIAAINTIIVKKGDKDLPGITDRHLPRRLGPKRANHIRKLFNLGPKDDVRHWVIHRKAQPKKEGSKAYNRAPKIQRLITPLVKQHRRRLKILKKRRFVKSKQEAADYAKLMAQINKDKRHALISKKRSMKDRASKKSEPKKEGHSGAKTEEHKGAKTEHQKGAKTEHQKGAKTEHQKGAEKEPQKGGKKEHQKGAKKEHKKGAKK